MVLSKENNEDETGMLAQEFKIMLERIDFLIHENYEKQLLAQKQKSVERLAKELNLQLVNIQQQVESCHWY